MTPTSASQADTGITGSVPPGRDVSLVTPSRQALAAGRPLVLIVMGVSGCGKSTAADAVADRLGWQRLEGDDLHPQSNIDKMSKGIPLTDDDRKPWLDRIATHIRALTQKNKTCVITCSSLKKSYRTILSGESQEVCFLYLKGTKEQIAPRLGARKGHFMPTTLLDSQFAVLEEPGQDENMMELDVEASPDDLAKAVVEQIETLPWVRKVA